MTVMPGQPESNDHFDGRCAVCGVEGTFENGQSAIREGYPCQHCGGVLRDQGQAVVILDLFAKEASSSIAELVKEHAFRHISVYEPGVLGPLRSFLRTLNNYHQSAYWADVERGAMRDGLRCQDIMDLTFEGESFDLIITSDIFEHVRRPYQGFCEIRRVLKPEGVHVFSVPVLHSMPAKSVVRVDTSGDEDVFLLDPIYHGPTHREHLVYTDFGADMIEQLNAMGLETHAVRFERGSDATRKLLTFYSVRL